MQKDTYLTLIFQVYQIQACENKGDVHVTSSSEVAVTSPGIVWALSGHGSVNFGHFSPFFAHFWAFFVSLPTQQQALRDVYDRGEGPLELAQGDFRHPLGPLTFLLGKIFFEVDLGGYPRCQETMFCSTALVYLTGYKGVSKDAVVMYEGEWSLCKCMDF